jgi:hypothetical protein
MGEGAYIRHHLDRGSAIYKAEELPLTKPPIEIGV